MATVLEILGSGRVVTSVLIASTAVAILVILGVIPGAVLWIALVAALMVVLAQLTRIVRTKSTA